MSSIDLDCNVSSPLTGTQLSTRELLVDLGFEAVVAQCTDQQPGYRYDFGNFVLDASQLTCKYFRQEILFSGILSTQRSIRMVEFWLPLEVENYEQGAALLAYYLGSDFTPLKATPWLLLGRTWEEHLPWRRELRLYEQRPRCLVEADWFKVAVKKLVAAGEAADQDAKFSASYDGSALRFDISGQVIVMPATGAAWPQSYSCRTQGLKFLSKRTPSQGVSLSVWQDQLVIGGLHLPLEGSN